MVLSGITQARTILRRIICLPFLPIMYPVDQVDLIGLLFPCFSRPCPSCDCPGFRFIVAPPSPPVDDDILTNPVNQHCRRRDLSKSCTRPLFPYDRALEVCPQVKPPAADLEPAKLPPHPARPELLAKSSKICIGLTLESHPKLTRNPARFSAAKGSRGSRAHRECEPCSILLVLSVLAVPEATTQYVSHHNQSILASSTFSATNSTTFSKAMLRADVLHV